MRAASRLALDLLRSGARCRNNIPAIRMLSGSSIQSLKQAFLDPNSPFHLQEGEIGPASPDDTRQTIQSLRPPSPIATAEAAAPSSPQLDFTAAAEAARSHALSQGHDPGSFWEQKVTWGDMDAFRHVNNTIYGETLYRVVSQCRIQWLTSLGEEAGGETTKSNLLAGKGISVILKTITYNFKRPVVFPDTLLISLRVHPTTPPSPTQFHHSFQIYSYTQRAVVVTSNSVMVWYDYDKLKKAEPPEEIRIAVQRQMRQGEEQRKWMKELLPSGSETL